MADDNPKKIESSDIDRPDRLPPGQVETDDWPIFSFRGTPEISMDTWRLRIFGLVGEEKSWNWKEFRKLPVTEVHSDWHCVTTWSKLDLVWTGVLAKDLLKGVIIKPEAKAVMFHSYDGYTTNLLIGDFLDDDVLFAWGVDGADFKPEQGWPLRLIVPKLYAWKSGKWVNGIEFIAKDKPGYWESHGYHIRGNPWEEERRS
jgi:DMSO/TMAO reductase YedYZ molybdopterin-dependent catalytic subunit